MTVAVSNRLEFDPFLEVRGQSSTPEGQSVAVVRPIDDLAAVCPNDGSLAQRDWNLALDPAEKRLDQRGSNCPFGNYTIPAQETQSRPLLAKLSFQLQFHSSQSSFRILSGVSQLVQ